MIETIFFGIVVFLCMLAVFDLVVGVSNDAVNFVNSAIGAKVASFKTIIAIAAVGVFAGAAMSNGMMDVARHGIFTPQYFTFYEVICIFLAVMVTDVILLDVFNTLGMPTSTTVSMVFELLGGAFALALVKMVAGATDTAGQPLGLGDLLNTDKALSVIIAIFMSVAVAFIFGALVMWLSRLVFTFVKPQNRSVKTILFSAVSATAILWFLLIKGLKGSTLMTPQLAQWIADDAGLIILGCMAVMTVVMTLLALVGVNLLKIVVLMGTFALAMAFAGNDLVNFVGVPLSGLDAFMDFSAHGNSDPHGFMMLSLQQSAQTPMLYLMIAGLVMVLALIFSKKAQNVVKTSVDLSRQDEGDEMFGSSRVARTLVRTSSRIASTVNRWMPMSVKNAIDKRFNTEQMTLEEGAAFDMVRAAVNLVLAGLLVALGTTYKLPLSTTYVTFMVAMGASLADRAWSRESAVFRITGVISVIGGWFITAAVAFSLCMIVSALMYYGSYVAMLISIIIAVALLVRSNIRYARKAEKENDSLFTAILHTRDKQAIWQMLCEHIRLGNAARLRFVIDCYYSATDALLSEYYAPLRRGTNLIDEERKALKRQRRREIVSMRKLDSLTVLERNTWYFLGINSCQQMLYGLKRINDPIREHVGNNFPTVGAAYRERFVEMRDRVVAIYERTLGMLQTGDFTDAETLRDDSRALQRQLSTERKHMLDIIQNSNDNPNTALLTIHILQESQELIGCLRHMIRGMNKFAGAEN